TTKQVPGSNPEVYGDGDHIDSGGEKADHENGDGGRHILGEAAHRDHEYACGKERIAEDAFLAHTPGNNAKEQRTNGERYFYRDTQRAIKGVIGIIDRRLLKSHVQVLDDEVAGKHR